MATVRSRAFATARSASVRFAHNAFLSRYRLQQRLPVSNAIGRDVPSFFGIRFWTFHASDRRVGDAGIQRDILRTMIMACCLASHVMTRSNLGILLFIKHHDNIS